MNTVETIGQKPLEDFVISTADTDFYQMTMAKLAREQFPGVKARYEFICRDEHFVFPPHFAQELRTYVDAMSSLTMSEKEKAYILKSHPYIGQEHMDWVSEFRFDPSQVQISQENGKLKITIEGPWETAIFWETPLMALIVGLYNHMSDDRKAKENWEIDAVIEAQKAKKAYEEFGWQYTEFGSRRRYNLGVQKKAFQILHKFSGRSFRGTSNPHIGSEHDVDLVGTFAHQLVMFMAARFGYKAANRKALEYWKETFGGYLGAALTDTYTHEEFFDIFDWTKGGQHDWVKVFRHDSGPEREFAEYIAALSLNHGRYPFEFNLLYTNGLTIDEAIDHGRYAKHLGFNSASAGIGTHLSHNLTRQKGLNIVIKPTAFFIPEKGEWIHTTKLSQSPGKISGPAKEQALEELGLIIVEDGITKEKKYVKRSNM